MTALLYIVLLQQQGNSSEFFSHSEVAPGAELHKRLSRAGATSCSQCNLRRQVFFKRKASQACLLCSVVLYTVFYESSSQIYGQMKRVFGTQI